MLIRISRYLIITLAIFVASIYIPDLYWLSFSQPVRHPFVTYSPIKDSFLIGKIEDRKFKWSDLSGNYYTMEEVDSLLPLFNYRQLAAKGKLPDSVRGWPVTVEEIRLNNFRQRTRPSSIEAPQMGLYPLFESNPPRVELEMPLTYFRITERMEFIDAASNTIVDSLTELFTNALKEDEFVFPAKLIAGNPTTRKPFDEGYFIVDAQDDLYHVKMYNGQPVVHNTNKPDDVQVREIFISERNLREFYGLLISKTNNIYLIMYDDYRLQRLPINHYEAFSNVLVFQGNPLYRIISVTSENQMMTYVTNRDYELIATHEETWPGKFDRLSGKVFNYLFPFTLSLQSADRPYVDFYTDAYQVKALFLSLVFAGVYLVVGRKKRKKHADKWIDTVIILVTGLYGFLAIILIPGMDD